MTLRCARVGEARWLHAVSLVGSETLCEQPTSRVLADRDFDDYAATYPHLVCRYCVRAAKALHVAPVGTEMSYRDGEESASAVWKEKPV